MVSDADIDWQDPAYEAAAEWVVRLHASAPNARAESDWLAFAAWLDAAPANRVAYDAAEALWNEADRQSRALRTERSGASPAGILSIPMRSPAAAPVWWAATAAAAASLLLFFGPFSLFRAAAPTVYSTAKGEHRLVVLPDGSQIAMNGGSSLSVLVDGQRREVTLAKESEAAFTVVHDPLRPFVIQAGDRAVRDIGTEFNVLRASGALTVTVRKGLVEVAPSAGAVGQTVALSPGRQLQHEEGSVTSKVAEVAPDDAFGWRSGRFIYRDRPLAEVAADLSRYYASPVRTEGLAGSLRFSGVLEAANEPEAIQRLSALVPVSANTQDGVIVLRKRGLPR
jgi:transmembrane sensor